MSGQPYAAREPCGECPFLKIGGVRLNRERARGIASDASFPCHKTCDYDDGEGDAIRTSRSLECAGKLLFHINGRFTQMMRIASRLGWSPDAMRGHERVFDSLAAFLRAHNGEPGRTGDGPRRRL